MTGENVCRRTHHHGSGSPAEPFRPGYGRVPNLIEMTAPLASSLSLLQRSGRIGHSIVWPTPLFLVFLAAEKLVSGFCQRDVGPLGLWASGPLGFQVKLLSGSLWVCMALHVAIDLVGGVLALRLGPPSSVVQHEG